MDSCLGPSCIHYSFIETLSFILLGFLWKVYESEFIQSNFSCVALIFFYREFWNFSSTESCSPACTASFVLGIPKSCHDTFCAAKRSFNCWKLHEWWIFGFDIAGNKKNLSCTRTYSGTVTLLVGSMLFVPHTIYVISG